MRLITHNMLQCNARGCTSNNFPLRIADAELEETEAEFNADFLKRMLPKLEWGALVETAYSLGIDSLPKELPENTDDEEFLKNLHHVLLETRVKEGKMICNNCNHVFPITDGIPNMLLTENEV
ncbi:Trm112p-domain-containing protein [Hyaloraphidium curvatum]|nr:Trm112p-domain-containing protein [Hyaloraphidium curvatum]